MKQFYQWLSLLTFVTVLLLGTSSASAFENHYYYLHAKVNTNMKGAGYVYGIGGTDLSKTPTGETLSPEMAAGYKLESMMIVSPTGSNGWGGYAPAPISIVASPREGYRFAGWRGDNGEIISGDQLYQSSEVMTYNDAGTYDPSGSSPLPADPHEDDPDYCDATFTAVFDPIEAFSYNGVWYIVENHRAYIAPHPDRTFDGENLTNPYKGNIVIPSEVQYKGERYTVVGFVPIEDGFGTFTNSDITTIRLPGTITIIPGDEFRNCLKLTSVTCDDGSSELTVGSYAFYGCTSLTDVKLPKQTQRIYSFAFADCSALEMLTIPQQCSTLGDKIIEGCSNLKSLVLLPIDPPTLNSNYVLAEDEVVDNLKFFACVKDFSKYISADYWSDFFGQFYAYVMGADGNTCGTAAFGTLTRPNLNNIPGLTAYQTVGGIIRDGKLLVKRVNYAFNTNKPAGDGIIFKVEKPNTPYLLDEKMSQYVTQTDDKCLIPVYDYELTLYQSEDNSKTFYTLDEKNAVWRKITDNVTLDRGQCYLSLPGSPNDMPDMLEMVLSNGTNPFGIKGDINGDGIVDVSDVNIAIDIVLGKDSNDNYGNRADLTGDGNVDVSDVSLIIDIVLGKN